MKIEQILQAILNANQQKRRSLEAVLTGKKAIPSPADGKDLRLVSLSDAARILGVSRYTIYRLIEKKQITTRRLGGVIRVSMDSLRKLSERSDEQ